MWVNRRIKPDPERDIERFKPFIRVDYDTWNPFLVPFTYFLFIPRVIILFTILFNCMFQGHLLSIGVDWNKPMSPTKKRLLTFLCWYTAHGLHFFLGFLNC
jgi:hypothetical protein